MKQLYFLIVVFGAAIFLSFYYSNEGFNSAVANSALQTELADLNKTMNYLRGVGINENSANVTFNTTAARIKEINAILNPAAAAAASTPTALLTAELAELNKTMNYLRGVGINENSANVTFNKTAARIQEINGILGTSTAAPVPAITSQTVAAAAPMPQPPVVQQTVSVAPFSRIICPPGKQFYNGGCVTLNASGMPTGGAPVRGTCPSDKVEYNNACWGPCPSGTIQVGNRCFSDPVVAASEQRVLDDENARFEQLLAERNRLTDSSGNNVPVPPPGVTVDASGNVLSNRLKDLISILTQSNVPLKPAQDTVKDISNNSQPMPLESDMSNNNISQFYKMLKPQIHNDITNAVNKGFERSTVLPTNQKRNTPPSPAIAQGMAWPYGPGGQQHCGGQEDTPDMNEYIRKDSIPCWACDVKY